MSLNLFKGLLKPSLPLRLSLFGLVALYLLGYQPVLAFPPILKVVVHAEGVGVTQQSQIEAVALPQAFNLPHPGYISTNFSAWHPGTDIATGLGMPIHPILDGRVVDVEYTYFGLGHFVVIQHPAGFKSTYGHLGRIYVNPGDEVKQTTVIGEVGLSGRTSGPHTHLELTLNNSYVDPMKYLPALPNWPDPATYSGPHYENAPTGGYELHSTEPVQKVEVKVDIKKELKFTL